mmetsp:Transcript_22450/g.90040  ORF Transcript_22450/g.90040 Transcript_22450/m.90040 type:complete len:110 (-) Transcript_22450:1100-1429(-)
MEGATLELAECARSSSQLMKTILALVGFIQVRGWELRTQSTTASGPKIPTLLAEFPIFTIAAMLKVPTRLAALLGHMFHMMIDKVAWQLHLTVLELVNSQPFRTLGEES